MFNKTNETIKRMNRLINANVWSNPKVAKIPGIYLINQIQNQSYFI